MERINRLLRPQVQSYEPLPEQSGTTQERYLDEDDSSMQVKVEASTFEYVVFALVGIAMYVSYPKPGNTSGCWVDWKLRRLWSWNMFMACATYFQRRFATVRTTYNLTSLYHGIGLTFLFPTESIYPR